MDTVHRVIGFAVPGGFALLLLWSIWALIRNKAPGDPFWNVLGALQVVIGIQVVVGGVLFLTGARPATGGPTWLHYCYGGLFPAIVLFFAHRYAHRYDTIPWLVFGLAGFICFGLTFRALQTGMGWA